MTSDIISTTLGTNHILPGTTFQNRFFRIDATFEDVFTDKIKIIFKQIFNSANECDKVKAFAVDKNEENFDRLEIKLAKITS